MPCTIRRGSAFSTARTDMFHDIRERDGWRFDSERREHSGMLRIVRQLGKRWKPGPLLRVMNVMYRDDGKTHSKS
jgi:hypothetical protein